MPGIPAPPRVLSPLPIVTTATIDAASRDSVGSLMASLDRPAAVRARRSPFHSPTLSSMPPLIRLATERDLEAINAIYNHYVPISTTTYDDEPMSLEERRTSFASRQSIH